MSTKAEKLVNAAADKAPAALAPYIKMAAPLMGLLLKLVDVVAPLFSKGQKFLSSLPAGVFDIIIGLLLCLFGGTFNMSISAYQAFRNCGWDNCKNQVSFLVEEFKHLEKGFDAAAKKDLNSDGIPDQEQMSGSELLSDTIATFMKTCKDPQKITDALQGILTGIIGVIATLKSNLVKATVLGAAIGDSLIKPAEKYGKPALEQSLDPAYHKWIPQIIMYGCKGVAVFVALFFQRIISSVHSGIQGGQMLCRGAIVVMKEKALLPADFDAEKMHLVEMVGYFCALYGAWSQVTSGFNLSFPFNILFFPLTVFEYVLAWICL